MEARYLHMTIEELAEDADFILAIQSNLHRGNWREWSQSQDVEVQERLDKAIAIVSSLSGDIKPHRMDDSKVEQLWSRIEGSTNSIPNKNIAKQKARTIPIWVYISSVAAAIALLVLVNSKSSTFEITNTHQELMALSLPSDSKVSLTTESTIHYEKDNWDVERNINLKGSASFDVTKGVPFHVITSEGSVHVLGTAFEVVERKEVFMVAVERGLVRVESGLNNMELGAGMTFLKNPTLADLNKLKGKYSTFVDFQNMTFNDAREAISILYNISFKGMESEGNRKFNGSFDSNNLEEALQKVIWAANLKYEIQENVVTLFR